MPYGICNLSIVPIRIEASENSEMINQLLFGEYFKVLEQNKYWSKIIIESDELEGYIDNKQYEEISSELYFKLTENKNYYSKELIEFVTDKNNVLTTITLGANLPFYNKNKISINHKQYNYQGKIAFGVEPKKNIIKTAYLYFNAPYLKGGRTPFGIDAPSFVQSVYKLCGYTLFASIEKMSKQGEGLSFIEEAEPGDLAFFDDEQGNINHVGIVMLNYHIMHSFGKVRIDKLDHTGIYNTDTKNHTHKLRMIRKIV